jgi:hypothetical protein
MAIFFLVARLCEGNLVDTEGAGMRTIFAQFFGSLWNKNSLDVVGAHVHPNDSPAKSLHNCDSTGKMT